MELARGRARAGRATGAHEAWSVLRRVRRHRPMAGHGRTERGLLPFTRRRLLPPFLQQTHRSVVPFSILVAGRQVYIALTARRGLFLSKIINENDLRHVAADKFASFLFSRNPRPPWCRNRNYNKAFVRICV